MSSSRAVAIGFGSHQALSRKPRNIWSPDHNLERIRRLFGNLLSFAWRWSVDLVASLYFFYSGSYHLLQKAQKCRLNQPG